MPAEGAITPPVVIILAAGKGQRFRDSGGQVHKLDALLDGKTVLAHVLDAVKAAGLPWHLVRPSGGTGGMGESIALGVTATAGASGWLILPGDLPLIQPDTLRRVALALSEKPVVVPYYQLQHGHPVGFGRDYFTALSALQGDKGAGGIVQIAHQRGEVVSLALSDRGIVDDVDTAGDLRAIQRRHAATPTINPA
ncbi:nucleotidyltransferase family protein [Atlantibacter hermannii]|uniref:nucleotidyltransferase family protein n=1 Tax=Atlantibacter hermannii TaxID=565 RepID=UPI001931B071|nr:nucleotidyltransferase family protein [Atlantibacter hermannii]MBL7637140.1 nucleotidyltransferase family protein [Atlantibacter hermannii]MBL7675668.1 nucleotidyltransferase family protein [Atlantibacter hermannii]